MKFIYTRFFIFFLFITGMPLTMFTACGQSKVEKADNEKTSISDSIKETENKGEDFTKKKIKFQAADGVEITADVYKTGNADATWILLFHQAGFSRGSYEPIAPKLNEMGYNCIAIDQRSGNEARGVENETKKAAVKMEKATEYADAYPDLEATLKKVKEEFKAKKTIVWGSSYSAALVFILASKNSGDIDALLSFAPGEYFEFEGKKISEFAADVKCPVFITGAQKEETNWRPIFNRIPGASKAGFVPKGKGEHGSRALWNEKTDHKEYWFAVKAFLSGLGF